MKDPANSQLAVFFKAAFSGLRGLLAVWTCTVAAGAAVGVVPDGKALPAGAPNVERNGNQPQRWGKLEISRLYLQAPASLLEFAETPDQRTVWNFPGNDWAAVRSWLEKTGLSVQQLEEISAPNRRVVSASGLALTPSVDFLVGLSASARQAIHAELGRHEVNPDHRKPLLIFGDFEEWSASSGLSAAQRALVRSLLWRKGNLSAFSDVSALVERAASTHEITEARRFMTRRHSYLVRVSAPEPATRGAFTAYWGANGRNRDVLPLLDALTGGAGRDSVDLALLLPPMARERLYAFPALKDAVAGRLPDCHWTSLNFFSVKPEPYYLDSRVSFLELMQGYAEVQIPEELGDLVCYVSAEGAVLHSCVHLADDLVFTKNGQSLFSPWLILRRSEVEDIYRAAGATSVRFLRRKEAGGGS